MGNRIINFFRWIKSSFNGYDGKPSHQKLLVAYFTILFTFIVISVGAFNFYYPEPIYHIIAGTILGQSAIRAWQTTRDHQISANREIKEMEHDDNERERQIQ